MGTARGKLRAMLADGAIACQPDRAAHRYTLQTSVFTVIFADAAGSETIDIAGARRIPRPTLLITACADAAGRKKAA